MMASCRVAAPSRNIGYASPIADVSWRCWCDTHTSELSREGFHPILVLIGWCLECTCFHRQVRARAPALECSRPNASAVAAAAAAAATAERAWAQRAAALRTAVVRQQLFFPDRRLMQYDCGKLQASRRKHGKMLPPEPQISESTTH